MPANRPPHRNPMLKYLILLVCIFSGIGGVYGSEIVIDEELIEYTDSSKAYLLVGGGTGSIIYEANVMVLHNVDLFGDLSYITVTLTGYTANAPPKLLDGTPLENGVYLMDCTLNGRPLSMRVYITTSYNLVGDVVNRKITFFPQNWDLGADTGVGYIDCPFYFVDSGDLRPFTQTTEQPVAFAKTSSLTPRGSYYKGGREDDIYINVASASVWENVLTVTKDDYLYTVNLDRVINKPYSSQISLYKDDILVNTSTGAVNFTDYQAIVDLNNIIVTSATDNNYSFNLSEPASPDDPGGDPSTATVYIQNSQSGALLANSHLSILASAAGTLVEVINTTLPAGTGSFVLQPTGGGSPNPDYYRAYATVPGFSQIIENHSFTLTGPHDVIIEMRPDSGGPTDPENCYLEFYVRDLHANPIASASVQCDGRIKQTNSQGYAVFEVSKNATYPYVAKKSGYVTIEGTATVADGPRYVANVVLGPGTVPTYTPTLGPGETPGGPGATPTPDTRTNEQKGQAIIDLIADFAEPIAILAILATIFGLMKMMTPGRR